MSNNAETTRKFILFRNSIFIVYALTFVLSFLIIVKTMSYIMSHEIEQKLQLLIIVLVCLVPVIFFVFMCYLLKRINRLKPSEIEINTMKDEQKTQM